jgi:hypothetical protein
MSMRLVVCAQISLHDVWTFDLQHERYLDGIELNARSVIT